jgi:hypothetical protein
VLAQNQFARAAASWGAAWRGRGIINFVWINKFEHGQTKYHVLIYFWEPLDTDAPEEAKPHCCLIDWVVFYKHSPEVSDGGGLAAWDQVTTCWNLLGTRWTDANVGWSALAPFVLHDGEVWELVTGKVVWRAGCWFMRWCARRIAADDIRLMNIAPEYDLRQRIETTNRNEQ